MQSRKITVALLVLAAGGLILWDIYATISPGGGDTISEVTLGWARKHPSFGWAFGILCGHLMWPQKIKDA
jgi:hypothetical protein